MNTLTPDKGKRRNPLSEKAKKRIGILSVIILILFWAAIFWFAGRPMLRFVSQPQQFRTWVDTHGIWSYLAFVGMMTLQIVVAIIPGEPLEIGAGYAFGAIEGTLLCLVSILLGSAIIFGLVRRYGIRLIEAFFPIEKIRSIKLLQNPRRLNLTAFIVFFIPGTPKDLLSYLVGLTNMKFRTWLLISGVARIPSVVTSTIGGDALGMQKYTFAIVVFAVTLLVSAGGILVFNVMNKRSALQQPPAPAPTQAPPQPDPTTPPKPLP